LAKLEFNEGVALKTVLFLSIFPTAYFLSAPYTEGLFFALVIASFYYARLGKWHFAGLLSLFASLTRLAGLLLMPVLLIEYFNQKGWKLKKIDPKIFCTVLALIGFLTYLNINNHVTGNPFTFISIEATHWSNRFDPLAGLTSAYSWATGASYPDKVTIGIAPITFAAFGLLMIGVAVWKRLRPSYIVYMLLSWGLAVSTSWWISVPRYVMAMFPIFLLLGLLVQKKATIVPVVLVSVALLCYFTAIFARGWWAF
jgi:Gpi18-like mannosyltransferase